MKFLKRKVIEDKLNNKMGVKRIGWLTNSFANSFESNYAIKNLDLGDTLNLVKSFLRDKHISNIFFFPDSTIGWETVQPNKVDAPIIFDTLDETMTFLKENIAYGTDNYYLTNENIDWILAICHELDFHIAGSKQFVDDFKKNIKPS